MAGVVHLMWGGAVGLPTACCVRLSRPAQTGGFAGVCFVGLEKDVATDLHRVQARRMGWGALWVEHICLALGRWCDMHWGAGWGHTPCPEGDWVRGRAVETLFRAWLG